MQRRIPKPRRNRRTFEKHPDDPGREPYRVVDLYDLRDRMILAYGNRPQVNEGHLLLRASLFRPFDRGHPQDGDMRVGRSYWGHSAASALGFCLRVCHGYADWHADRYVALPYEEWVEQINKKEIDHPALWDLPAMRRAAQPEPDPPDPSVQQPVPVDPLAPTDPAPPPVPHPAPRDRVSPFQLALAF